MENKKARPELDGLKRTWISARGGNQRLRVHALPTPARQAVVAMSVMGNRCEFVHWSTYIVI